MDPARVLVVQHEVGAPAGWFGDALQESGCRLTVATPYDGSGLPALDGFAGLLVLGGAVDSWDDEAAPGLPATRDLVRRAERDRLPVLGICLGHQIAAHALGGASGRNPAGRTISIEPVSWLPAAGDDPLVADCRTAGRAVHWNRDVVLTLPDGATTLACSADGAVQAGRLGECVWGIQSHPEVDAAIVAEWMDEEWDTTPAAEQQVLSDLVDAVRSEEHSLRSAWLPLAESFARLVREGVPSR
ncbi:MAG TPA: type 1 glutamine amidotransferase [Pedococcus sp.]|nr:type 1 glutamine amidotransferase [Pedococcus sp.]